MTRSAKRNGDAALLYVRFNEDEVTRWRRTPGVQVLAESPYVGEGTPDAVYGALEADAASMALYDSVYPRAKIVVDGMTFTPPFRFGQMG